jgi:hypothetical protein
MPRRSRQSAAAATPDVAAASRTAGRQSGRPEETAAPQQPPAPPRKWVAALLAVGCLLVLGLWAARDPAEPAVNWWLGPWRWAFVLLAAVAGFTTPAARWSAAIGRRIAAPAPAARRRVALALALAASGYLLLTALLQDRDLFPKTHDDLSYLLQIRMLSVGRLWLPAHPLPDFFDTFYVLARPVYASLYFPGAALLYLPTAWLDLPTWVLPLAVAGACVGLVYRVVAELIDGSAGLLAAVLLLATSYFRMYSVMLTSHEPMLLLGLLLVWAWLCWRRSARPMGWAVLIGVLAGWAAITRPADAVCFAMPVGVAMLLRTFRMTDVGRGRRVAALLACLVAGAAPFLALQAWFNVGVTGSVLQTPYGLYLRQDQPGSAFGFHAIDPAARPVSVVPQKQVHFDQFYAPLAARHTPSQAATTWLRRYGPLAADVVAPLRLMLVAVPVGLLALRGDRRRWVLIATVPLLLAVYVLNPFFLEHYALVAVPGMAVLMLLGWRTAAAALPGGLAGRGRSAVAAGWLAACVAVLPEGNALWAALHDAGTAAVPTTARLQAEALQVTDEPFRSATMAIRQAIPHSDEIAKPALIFVRWNPGDNIQAEPVYNVDTAWPDEAEVIFAHDLGEARNRELITHYRRGKPNLRIYLWDRREGPAGVGVPMEWPASAGG